MGADVDDNQVKGFVVEKDTPGFVPVKIEGKIALRIVQNAEIALNDVRVPEANRLQNINSFRDVAEILRFTRSGVAWQALGVMIGAYELALAYAKERQQFGRPIAGFQMVQDLLVKSLGDITASWGMLVQLARLQDQGIFAMTTRRWPRGSPRPGCGRSSRSAARSSAATASLLLDYDIARFFADAEALDPQRGHPPDANPHSRQVHHRAERLRVSRAALRGSKGRLQPLGEPGLRQCSTRDGSHHLGCHLRHN